MYTYNTAACYVKSAHCVKQIKDDDDIIPRSALCRWTLWCSIFHSELWNHEPRFLCTTSSNNRLRQHEISSLSPGDHLGSVHIEVEIMAYRVVQKTTELTINHIIFFYQKLHCQFLRYLLCFYYFLDLFILKLLLLFIVYDEYDYYK